MPASPALWTPVRPPCAAFVPQGRTFHQGPMVVRVLHCVQRVPGRLPAPARCPCPCGRLSRAVWGVEPCSEPSARSLPFIHLGFPLIQQRWIGHWEGARMKKCDIWCFGEFTVFCTYLPAAFRGPASHLKMRFRDHYESCPRNGRPLLLGTRSSGCSLLPPTPTSSSYPINLQFLLITSPPPPPAHT